MTHEEAPQRSQPLPKDSDWLLPFLPQLRATGPKILEIGCGPGLDAATLVANRFEVTAFDRRSVARAREAVPTATFLRADLATALPFRTASFDVALSSLALHYLPWIETRAAFAEIRRVVRAGAPFLFRVNATDDFAHGAGKGELLEPNFYRDEHHYHADTKRFFDEAAMRAAVDGLFVIAHLEHKTVFRYDDPKRAWECLAFAN
ncbi:MAG: methyltransferase domain-containing protein [bacterium]